MSSNLTGSQAAGVEPRDKAVDPGFLSVRVATQNDTEYNLNVAAVDAVSGEWDPRNRPKVGDLIPARGGSATWVIYTDDPNEDVAGRVQLVGAGSPSITYNFQNPKTRNPSCNASGNDVIQATPKRENPADNAHPIWMVTLTER